MKRIIVFLVLFLCAGFLLAQQQQYEMRMADGKELFKQNRFDDAKDRFEAVKRMTQYFELPPEVLAEADRWIRRCNEEERKRRQRFNVSSDRVSFSSFGGYAEISVKAGSPWKVAQMPDWCEVKEKNASLLRLFCQENGNSVPRVDTLLLEMGERQHVVLLKQEAGESLTGMVVFRTNPNNAKIDFWDGFLPKYSSEAYVLKEGSYKVRVSKEGYVPVDTMIQVHPALTDTSKALICDIELKPVFAQLALNVAAQSGSYFQLAPILYIGNRKVDLTPMFTNSIERSFDDQGPLSYFTLYKGDVVPVPAGRYALLLTAEGFDEYRMDIEVEAGEVLDIDAEMKLISGFLTLMDGGGAEDARIFIDERMAGKVPAYRIQVGEGRHSVRLEKDGYMSDEPEYEVDIVKGKEQPLSISMKEYLYALIASEPAGAEILVDGKRKGFTPQRISLTAGEHRISLRKVDFMEYKKTVQVDPSEGQSYDMEAILEASHPLRISSDAAGFEVIVKRKKDVLVSGVRCPADIELPYGRYTVELRRDNGKLAYKGLMRHTAKRSNHEFLSYSRYNFSILGGDYFLTPLPYETSFEESTASVYKRMADVYFGKVKILPGLSSTILKSSFFSRTKAFDAEVLPETEDFKSSVYPNFMFSGSCILLNGDFRIGGSLHKNIDINFLGSYTWYPDMTKFLPLSHMDGHDIFIGIELGSRISIFNMNLKMGAQIFKGGFNVLREKQSGSTVKDLFASFSTEYTGFVVSIGFTLGAKDAKGSNVLRVFHL